MTLVEELYDKVTKQMEELGATVYTISKLTSNWTESIQLQEEFTDFKVRLGEFVEQQLGVPSKHKYGTKA